MQTVLRCHAAAYAALHGASAEILYDRMKIAVDREVVPSGPDPGHIVYNRILVEFARHYGYLANAGKASGPRARSSGRCVPSAKTSSWAAASGTAMTSMPSSPQWLEQVANARVYATMRQVVREHFSGGDPRRAQCLLLLAGRYHR